ncbi:MAG: hypothetical protein ACKVHE_32035 [Planctomycetales bacterium]|jgi:hypothetical protein
MTNTEQKDLPPQSKGERFAGPLFGFLAMLAVNAAYLAYKGVFIAPDSSFYMLGADQLVNAGFDFQSFLEASPAFGQYIGFVTWCAILKSIVGDNWPTAVVGANAVANALTVAMSTHHLRRVGICWQARLATIVWCMIAFDFLVWSKGLLSVPTFLVLGTSVVTVSASCVRPCHRNRARQIGTLLLAMLLSAAAICWRPTGIALVVSLGVCLLLQLIPQKMKINRVLTLLAIGVVVEAGFLVFAHFMAEPDSWPLAIGGGNISYTAQYYDQGQIVWKRYATYHAEPESLIDYHLITLDRLRYWFACYESEFRFAHKLYNYIFYIPLFLGSTATLILWTFRAFRDNEQCDRLVTVLLSTVLAFSAMHAMLQVDYGWRYRVPIIPCLMLLTAIAVHTTIQHRRRTSTGPGKRT